MLHLRSSAGVYGAENVIIELAKHSRDFGYHSILGAIHHIDDPYPEFLIPANGYGIDTVVFSGKRRLDFSEILQIKTFIRDNHIDVLHCHGYKEDIYGISTFTKIPKVATNHLWKKMYWRMKLYCKVDTIMLRFYNRIIGVSDEIVEEMRTLGLKKATKIANGIDIDKYVIQPKSKTIMEKFQIDKDVMVLGMISSLTPEKSHHFAIKAFRAIVKRFPKTRLLIVGSGICELYLKKQVAQLGLEDTIIFAGRQSNIPDILSVIDIFLLPSLHEGLPMALLEAMAAGKAVIATRVGENPNVIEDGKTGILIDHSNAQKIEEAVSLLLSDKGQILQLGKNARDRVVKDFTSKLMTQKYCAIYDSLTKSEGYP